MKSNNLRMINGIYGEPYLRDSKYVADCRLLQSIYRVERGVNIRIYVGRDGEHRYGNYIDNGAESGVNFLEQYIFEYATYRVKNKLSYETIESDRLFNNLLSSQPMAFNLFCPLRKMLSESPERATDAIRRALPIYDISNVTDVDLEFIPANYKELTGDRSAMDAIIRFVDTRGHDSFIAIETKYSENLGSNVPSKRAQADKAILQLNCFNKHEYNNINDIKLTQIYRNFLLSETYGRSISAESYSLILAPERHPNTYKELESLRSKLNHDYKHKISSISLEQFIDNLIEHSPQPYSETFSKFKDRYLMFEKLNNL